ncbi:MAG TPA: hypothetical protein VHB48_15530 [Chitinophagaceae bacterium]|nr:hypothetical protein [Chitinophagaceae bacterium]
MLSAKSVIPECNIDSCLFNVLLGFEKEGVNHTKGNTTVTAKIENKFKNLFCLAVIDKDKRDLEYIKRNFDKLEELGDEDYFRLFRSCKGNHHYIIQMVPVIETWIINTASALNIEMRDFGINASNVIELKPITKTVTSKRDKRFEKLFKAFIKKATEQNFVPLLHLQNVAKVILEKNYNLDINELTNG